MLLTDEEISATSYNHFAEVAHVHDNDMDWDKWANDFARAIEATILAKLASAELPEPVGAYEEVVGHEEWQGCPSELIEMRDAYSADQLRQAYAQGAAAQLAEKPSGYLSQYNLEMLQQGYPQTIVMLEGAKRDVPLYTRRQA